ncbi:hypothetical protein D8B26_002586 [Coccidioides posadasii str. Silveira]|uniref:uncharacterized protein n=1 Tax=Coccidioides posadasii (strain RMSCC 757 / Silveira) TaxID=443226 RepID=UPI001BEDD632|nr:hypothetical protein D8B26_002586 [Coccidioides posadasii str. Silveira]
MAAKAIAVIAGVGPGTGASIARRFAKSYVVALLARNPDNYQPVVQEISSSGGRAVGISTDVSDGNSVKSAFAEIAKAFPNMPLAAAIYNVGGGLPRKPFLELSEDEFKAGFSSNGGISLFPGGHSAAFEGLGFRASAYTNFTGATASLRGSAGVAPFSTGKFALRALSQSLAREFGPQGIHVSHVVVDGIIDIERTKHIKLDAPDAKLSPDSIADTYWYLHTQSRTAFTQELDLRPYIEKW